MKNIYLLLLVALVMVASNAFSAPDEYKYGKGMNYPSGDTMGGDYITHNRVGGFSGKKIEKPGTEKTKINSADTPYEIRRRVRAEWPAELNPDDLIQSNPIMALILIKDDTVIFEKYQYETGPESIFNSESMAKTLTALVIGVLLDEGKISSLNDSVDSYIPEFKNIKFGKNTIKNLLQMRCGLSDISAGPTGGRYANIKYGPTGARGPEARNLYEYIQAAPTGVFQGYQYAYDPRCSDALSMLVSSITGKLLAEVFEEKIWRRIGSAHPSYWAKATNTNITSGANQFWAKPVDWIKIASLLVNKGKFNGQQIISESYVTSLTKDVVNRNSSGSYGYQTFTSRFDTSAWANGYLGQKIYFDSSTKSAMITFGVEEHDINSVPFWNIFNKLKLD